MKPTLEHRVAAFDLLAMASSLEGTFPTAITTARGDQRGAVCTVVGAVRRALWLKVDEAVIEIDMVTGEPTRNLPYGLLAFLPFVPVVTADGLCPRCHVSDLTLHNGGFRSMADRHTRICPACHGDEVAAVRAALPLSAPNRLQKTPNTPR